MSKKFFFFSLYMYVIKHSTLSQMLFLYFAEHLKLEFRCNLFKLGVLPIFTQIVNIWFSPHAIMIFLML